MFVLSQSLQFQLIMSLFLQSAFAELIHRLFYLCFKLSTDLSVSPISLKLLQRVSITYIEPERELCRDFDKGRRLLNAKSN